MDLLQQQADQSALDIASLSEFVIDTMAAVCAPVRDAEVNALRGIADPVELFRWRRLQCHIFMLSHVLFQCFSRGN